MKTYKIPVSWTVTADMEIKAPDLASAIALADEASLPTDPNYCEGSFTVDTEIISCVNDHLTDAEKAQCYIAMR